MNNVYLYPFIVVCGLLQAAGVSMNAALRNAVINPYLAATLSFLPIVFVFFLLFLTMPRPLPNADQFSAMPWWAPLGGIAGAVAVFAGLLFVDKVGSGTFNGLLITANIAASLAIDHFGLLGMPIHQMSSMRALGTALMVAGIALISRF